MTAGKLKIDNRRKRILEILRLEGRVSVVQIANTLRVTPATIRNDLTVLEQEGCLIRVPGGAALISGTAAQKLDNSSTVIHGEEKKAIGNAVAKLIMDGDTLFINSGTTSECVASALADKQNLNIVTNSIKVATKLGAVPSFRVLLIGGEINAQYGFTCGGDAQEQLEKYQADWAILSIDGVSAKCGITTHHAEEAIIDRMMVAAAKQTVIAADSSKIGRAGFSRVCECNQDLWLVTNNNVGNDALAELEGRGVKIILA